MKKTLDTTETPSRARMISNAGRIVSPVVWAAPETIPSATLLATIIGVTFALVTPPLVGADEHDQFERAFMIAEGQVFATWHGTHVGGTFPATLESELDAISHRVYSDRDRSGFLRLLSRPAPSGSPRFADVGLFASYGPGAYFPAAFVLKSKKPRVGCIGFEIPKTATPGEIVLGVTQTTTGKSQQGKWVLPNS